MSRTAREQAAALAWRRDAAAAAELVAGWAATPGRRLLEAHEVAARWPSYLEALRAAAASAWSAPVEVDADVVRGRWRRAIEPFAAGEVVVFVVGSGELPAGVVVAGTDAAAIDVTRVATRSRDLFVAALHGRGGAALERNVAADGSGEVWELAAWPPHDGADIRSSSSDPRGAP